MLNILKRVNIHSKDNGLEFIVKDRRNEIIKILEGSDWSQVIDDGFLLIYNNRYDSSNENTILISCHIDSVFNEGDYFIKESDDGKITGTLDNTGSIAILLDTMLSGKLPINVFVSFTGDEEEDSRGAILTAEYLRDEKPEVWERLGVVITLDVSNKNEDRDLSIENFFIEEEPGNASTLSFNDPEEFITYISRILDSENITYGILRDDETLPDESWDYEEFDLNVFSLCLPVSVNCREENSCHDFCQSVFEHCIKGVTTTKKQMEHVKKGIIAICGKIIKNSEIS